MAGYSRCSIVKTVGAACLLLLVITFIGHRFHSKLEKVTSFSYTSSKCAARNGNTLFMSNITSYKWNIGKTKLNSVLYQPLASYVNATDLTANGFEIKRTNVKCIGYMSAIITSTSSFYIGNRGKYMESASFSSGLDSCPLEPPNLGGSFAVNTTWEEMEDIEKRLSAHVLPGGWYRPKECIPRNRVAVIVPFRDRYAHLPIFLKNIHPFLMKQQIEYRIFIVEQTNGMLFNRAALMNSGFIEARKLFQWDCFIFHDIDLIPLDERNLYTCPEQPRHMSVAVDVFEFKLPYVSIFGGVSAMTAKQFKKVNGFSNSFWGWGGEDDDMSNRLKHARLHISRYTPNVARYTMLNHQKEKANPKRYENLAKGTRRFENDGLNSIKYEVYSFKMHPLFTWFLIELQMVESI